MSGFEWMLEWFAALPREYAFLLALPFLIAAAAFLKEAFMKEVKQSSPRKRNKGGTRTAHC